MPVRRLAELELEKQLAEQHKELIRREMEQIESHNCWSAPSADEGDRGPIRRKQTSEKED